LEELRWEGTEFTHLWRDKASSKAVSITSRFALQASFDSQTL
jgi:hypothetical protein